MWFVCGNFDVFPNQNINLYTLLCFEIRRTNLCRFKLCSIDEKAVSVLILYEFFIVQITLQMFNKYFFICCRYFTYMFLCENRNI